jgi:hypothetical protein
MAMADDYYRTYDIHYFHLLLVIYTFRDMNMSLTSESRFFFPDSPTNAWFLTPAERTTAVLRIKGNQTGVENKHFKREQYAYLSVLP